MRAFWRHITRWAQIYSLIIVSIVGYYVIETRTSPSIQQTIAAYGERLYFIGRYLAPLATVIGIIVACWTYSRNSSMKRRELISNIYNKFLERKLYDFYAKIRNGDTIKWQIKEEDKLSDEEKQLINKNERLLNKSLTLFDEVNYLETQGLLDDGAWEYIVCEIQYFAFNKSVWEYMEHRIEECIKMKFPENIMPFTGFPDLLNKVPIKFRAEPFPEVSDRYKNLIKEVKKINRNRHSFLYFFSSPAKKDKCRTE